MTDQDYKEMIAFYFNNKHEYNDEEIIKASDLKDKIQFYITIKDIVALMKAAKGFTK